MQETELKQNADFLSIALECLDSGSNDVAVDFIDDVASSLEDQNQAASLEHAAELVTDGDVADGRDVIEQVNAELLQDIGSL